MRTSHLVNETQQRAGCETDSERKEVGSSGEGRPTWPGLLVQLASLEGGRERPEDRGVSGQCDEEEPAQERTGEVGREGERKYEWQHESGGRKKRKRLKLRMSH